MAVYYKYLWILMMCGIQTKDADGACFLPPIPDKKGNSGKLFNSAQLADVDACKEFCDGEVDCKAAQFNSVVGADNCGLLSEAPVSPYEDDASFTLLIKQTCSDPCTMSRTTDTKGSDTHIQLKLTDADQCSSACLYMSECTGVAYSGGTCSLYDGTPSDINAGHTLTHVKDTCSGKDCCMKGTTTKKAANPALITLSSSIGSCEEACLASSNCHSVYFNNNICFMYTAEPTTGASTGSTYSTKSCTGSPTTTFTLTDNCYGAGEAKPTPTILFVTVMVAMAITSLL